MRWLGLLVAVAALAACDSGSGGSTGGTGSSGGTTTSGGSTSGTSSGGTVFPELAVTLVDGGGLPAEGLVFPSTVYGSSSSASFLIQSTSSADLHVSAFVFDGGDFSIQSDGGLPLILPMNVTATVTVLFVPTPPTPLPNVPQILESAGLIIQSDSHTQPDYPVPLTGAAVAPLIDICTSVNGAQACLSQDPNLTITFPPGPVGSLIGPLKFEVSDRSTVPLVVSAITLDPAATAAGYSIVETEANLGLPRVLSATTGLTVPFHVTLTPTQICAASGCLTGSVSVTSTDPHYTPANPPNVRFIGTGT
jgi:hypothetical protein